MNWPGISFTPHASLPFGTNPDAIDGSDSDGIHRFGHDAMACRWGLWIAGHTFDYADQVAFEAWSEVERLENLLSRYLPASEIHHLNFAASHGTQEWIIISAATLECLQLAVEVHQATEGAFDITIGSVIDARLNDDGTVREASEDEAWPGSGMKWLEIDQENSRARLLNPNLKLDLGAVGKGYALDCIAQILRDWSVESALLHAGQSSVLALGASPAGDCWEIALRSPDISVTEAAGKVLLCDRALSGSGMAIQGHHIIDPRDGRSARNHRATWAMSSSAALSDAISTAFMVMQATEIESFCQNYADVHALLMHSDGTLQLFAAPPESVPENENDGSQTQDTTV